MVSKFFSNQKYICLLFLLAGGFVSSLLQYELLWDFAHYHYYNAWAFMNNRFNQDILVAGLHGFFNPLPDVPLYLLIKYFNNYPIFISFMQGLWFGALMYMVFRLELLFFDILTRQGKIKVLVCFAIAMTGNALFLQIGTASNEIMLAFFYLLAFYLLVNEIFVKQTGAKFLFIFSGFLLGATMGLKLTGVLYCITSGITLIIFYKKIKNPWSNIAWFTIFGVIGFLTFSGFWMWKLWEEFQNPFFPFANGIFKSEWLSFSNFSDQNFKPQNWKEFLFWPFILSLTLHREEGKGMFVADFRFLIVYLVFLYFFVKYFYQYCRNKKVNFSSKWLFLSAYLLILYLLWVSIFSISRYFIVGEILIAFVLTQALFSKQVSSFWKESFYYAFLIFVAFVLLSTPYFSDSWGKRPIWDKNIVASNSYVGIEKVHLPDNALIQTYNYPTAIFFSFWAENQPTIKGVNIHQESFSLLQNNKKATRDLFGMFPLWQEKKENIIKEHQGPKLLLIANGSTENIWAIDFSKIKETKGMKCFLLRNNLIPYISLCVPKKIADQVFQKNALMVYESKN